jgi:hypothetical protein
MSRCAFVKPDGERCQRIVSSTATYCYSHDPSKAEERKRIAKQGGRKGGRGREKPLSEEVGEIKGRLRGLCAGVLTDDPEKRVEKGTAIVLNQILNTLLRAVELERKAHESEELEGRLEEIEQQVREAEQRKGRGHAR